MIPKIKLWVDDIREPAPGWIWATTSTYAIAVLEMSKSLNSPIHVMSLDHDLGGDDTTRPVVLWMCEHEWWPATVLVHTSNPVGREWLCGMVERYKTAGQRPFLDG